MANPSRTIQRPGKQWLTGFWRGWAISRCTSYKMLLQYWPGPLGLDQGGQRAAHLRHCQSKLHVRVAFDRQMRRNEGGAGLAQRWYAPSLVALFGLGCWHRSAPIVCEAPHSLLYPRKKQNPAMQNIAGFPYFNGAGDMNRTRDLLIKNEWLLKFACVEIG